MKNPYWEQLRRLMRQYHRHHPWHLDNGLFVPHSYTESRTLSWWDDVGFILNRRRVMVWWTHPRMEYADAITDMAWQQAGEPSQYGDQLFLAGEKQWKKAGRSRKKVVAYRSPPLTDVQQEYYTRLNSIEARLQDQGIELTVRPSVSMISLNWCTGITACLPIEVRAKEDIGELAALTRRLLKREVTLTDLFPDYKYDRADWLSESEQRQHDMRSRNLPTGKAT